MQQVRSAEGLARVRAQDVKVAGPIDRGLDDERHGLSADGRHGGA